MLDIFLFHCLHAAWFSVRQANVLDSPRYSLQSPAALSACLLSLLFLSNRTQCLTVKEFEFRSDCIYNLKPQQGPSTVCSTISSASHLIVTFSITQTDANLFLKMASVVKSDIYIQYALCMRVCGKCKFFHWS